MTNKFKSGDSVKRKPDGMGPPFIEGGVYTVTNVREEWIQLEGLGSFDYLADYFDLSSDKPKNKPEDSGGSCDYYKVPIENPTTAVLPYTAECNDVIEALEMTYAEANMFKEIWRTAAARTLGKLKAGHTALRGAEKIEFFANRNLIQVKAKQDD